MLLIGLESLRSLHQCYSGLCFRCSSVQHPFCRVKPMSASFFSNLHALSPWGAPELLNSDHMSKLIDPARGAAITELGAAPFFDGFRPVNVSLASRVTIRAALGGQGPPLLLLHGHPQTHITWRKVSPSLAAHFTVVAADLRGYGDSSKPDQSTRSNRAGSLCRIPSVLQ